MVPVVWAAFLFRLDDNCWAWLLDMQRGWCEDGQHDDNEQNRFKESSWMGVNQ